MLVEEGHTGVHHLLAESGWTTFSLESPDDYDQALWLLRLSSLYHVAVLEETAAGAEELGDVDVAAELAELEPSGPVLAAFERQ